ncbi:MAG: DUF2625 domain-containing protein [Eubacteriales bacterium]|nr:DUF2625 domain-containing protein [Eubacteriales bacterium]
MKIDLHYIYSIIEKSENNISLEENSAITINGYLRILGGNLITDYNEYIKEFYPGNKLIVAVDIFGGIYAISNNDFIGDSEDIWYFAPDSLEWEDLEIDYTQLINWAGSKDMLDFYKSFMFKNINQLIKELDINEGILIYPFLWAEQCNIETAEKKIVSIKELIKINADYEKQLKY